MRSTGSMFSVYCSVSYICASTKNLAGHGFVSVNKFGHVFIYITYFLCMIKYEYQRRRIVSMGKLLTGNAHMHRHFWGEKGTFLNHCVLHYGQNH